MKEWGDLSGAEKMDEMIRKNVGNKAALNVIKRAWGKNGQNTKNNTDKKYQKTG